MCGIVGIYSSTGEWHRDQADAWLRDMARSIEHRGPDDEGIWLAPAGAGGLAHRRLSIVDLSPGGHQPMVDAAGAHVIAFNGEIYNHLELRMELEAAGVRFRSSSDTEVLLEAAVRWGVVAACRRAAGMFAFALWDARGRRLWLARDRLGKKPLYLFSRDGRHAFASELKALWRFPSFMPDLDMEAIGEFLRYSYVGDHHSVFRDVSKVMPGTIVEIAPDGSRTTHVYWDLADIIAEGRRALIEDVGEAEEGLLALLRTATRERMLADVPLGAFLSGGIDSGLVVSLMQEASSRPVRTFSIGFHEASHDEAPVAKAVARHLGTDHTEMYVSERDAQDTVPLLPDIYDEPFADASQIPTYLLARLTRKHVTVALNGDGGDESFGGYARYRNQYGIVGALCTMPRPLRLAAAAGISTVPGRAWDAAAGLVPARKRPRFLASKVAKVARALRLDDATQRGKAYLSFWDPAEILRVRGELTDDPFPAPNSILDDPSELMQYWETRHYLPGDLLAKVDRATMAASLEARSPLLDHRVVEFAWRLPPAMKASSGMAKRILRQLLFRYVPRQLVDLPKQGFSVPIGNWMAVGLRDWSEAMLDYGRGQMGSILDWKVIDAAWRDHLKGRLGQAEKLWAIMMLCAWHERWLGGRAGWRRG